VPAKSTCSEDRNFFAGEAVSHQESFREYSGRGIVWRWRGSRGKRWLPIEEIVSGLRQDDPEAVVV
jgi:hypothetical protein